MNSSLLQVSILTPFYTGGFGWRRLSHVARAWRAGRRIRADLMQQKKSLDTQSKLPWVIIGLSEHLGDIVAAEPISRVIRQRYPSARILWCVRQPFAELLISNPQIDQVVIVNCLTEWMILKRSGIFHDVVDLHVRRKMCLDCGIPLLKRGGDRSIHMRNYHHHGHLAQIFARGAGIEVPDESPRVYPSPADVAAVNALELPPRFVAIHALSRDSTKEWPADNWRELAKEIVDQLDLDLVEIGDDSVLGKSGLSRYHNLCGKTAILQSAEVIRRAAFFLGIDSGPAHLAHAVGTFGIILLGELPEFGRYMPYGGDYGRGVRCQIIQAAGPVSSLSIEAVYRVVETVARSLPA